MKRTSYSLYLCKSALHACEYPMRDCLHTHLLAWADTTVGVKDYQIYALKFKYFNGKDVEKSCFPLVLEFADGQKEFWASACKLPPPTSALEDVRKVHAERHGATYRLFLLDYFRRRDLELSNRQVIQSLLYRARNLDTTVLEAQVLMAVTERMRSLSELSRACAVPLSHVKVSVYRLFLKGRLRLPITTERIHDHWKVGGGV